MGYHKFMRNHGKMKACLALDIGGSKCAMAAFEYPVELNMDPLVFKEIPTQKGLPHLKLLLKQLLEDVLNDPCLQNCELDSVMGVGTLGKVVNHERIEAGTAANIEAFKGEWADLNLKNWLEQCLGFSVYLENDAVCQLLGAIKKNELVFEVGTVVGYVGPGTGLGGAFFEAKPKGSFEPIGDGHIFDAELEINAKDHPFLSQKLGSRVAMAEDVISGRGIFELTGYTPLELVSDADLWSHYRPLLVEWGRLTGQLLLKLNQGTLVKTVQPHAWTSDTVNKIQKLSHVFIGGSIGTQDPISLPYWEGLNQFIKIQALPITLHKVQSPSVCGVFGAVMLLQKGMF